MQFKYTARDKNGNVVENTLTASGEGAAIDKIKALGFKIVEISEIPQSAINNFLNTINPLKPRVKLKDIVIFSRQLSTLIDAGVPLVQGLSVLTEQAVNPVFKEVLVDLKTDIESGISIADSMAKHPKAFDNLYVAMIRAGEVGGILDVILQRLSDYLESAQELRSKVKTALIYPTVVMSIAFLITVFILIFVIPTFKGIYAEFGADLPGITKFVLAVSDIAKSKFLYIFAVIGAAIFGAKKYYQTKKGAYTVDNYVLKVPLFGTLLKKVAISKFTRTLGTLIRSGVPILQGLETVAATAGNVVIEEVILNCRETVKDGGRLVEPLQKTDLFPPMVTQMINVGEETGSVDTMLVKIADFYDKEVDAAVAGLTSMIEPLMIVFMGIVIGIIIVAMMLPMLSLGDIVGKMS
ncbi:MAG TPA: type II secretion system F family protein [Elusimicrobiales bacterium]|nr:type II secretion system F family protein [Elusimicrobiales bacterium]